MPRTLLTSASDLECGSNSTTPHSGRWLYRLYVHPRDPHYQGHSGRRSYNWERGGGGGPGGRYRNLVPQPSPNIVAGPGRHF